MNMASDDLIKLFHFTDETDIIEVSCSSSDSLCSFSEEHHVCSENCANIRIKEVLHPSFAMYTWPCAPVLGKYIWHERKRFKGKNVLELGAGTALASVISAKCGAYVISTDSTKYSSSLKVVAENMVLNEISKDCYKTVELRWGYFTPILNQLNNISFILGSDIFYDPTDFEDVMFTISVLLQRNPSAEVWISYEHRCSDYNIDYLLDKWGLYAEEKDLAEFGADKFNVAGCDLPGLKKISVFVIRLKSERTKT